MWCNMELFNYHVYICYVQWMKVLKLLELNQKKVRNFSVCCCSNLKASFLASGNESSISSGWIAAIVIGLISSIGLTLAVVTVVIYCCYKKTPPPQQHEEVICTLQNTNEKSGNTILLYDYNFSVYHTR